MDQPTTDEWVEACKTGNLERIHECIERGITDWHLGFYSACEDSQVEVIELMIELMIKHDKNDQLLGECDVNCEEVQVRMDAVKLNSITLELMCEHGLHNWSNGMYMAGYSGHIPSIERMLEHDAATWTEGRYSGFNFSVLELSLTHVESVYHVQLYDIKNLNKGLCGACRGGHIPAIGLMLRMIGQTCKHGVTDWSEAIEAASGYPHIVSLLEDHRDGRMTKGIRSVK